MGLDVPKFGMDPNVVTAGGLKGSCNKRSVLIPSDGAEATGAEVTGAEATVAEAASKVSDEVIVAKAAAGEDGDPFLLEFVNLKSIGTSGLLQSLESEPQRLQSLE